MKEYKLLTGTWADDLERQINEFAEDGWIVKSVSLAYEGEDSSNEHYVVLLELDDDDSEHNLSDLYRKLDEIYDKLDDIQGNFQSGSLIKIADRLSNMEQTLQYIEGNTSN